MSGASRTRLLSRAVAQVLGGLLRAAGALS
jgi:hypothetical protein